tara:strand:- start:2346 stop:4871 length:2526 start_codon:yes stop_codon:yes gene_type:complete
MATRPDCATRIETAMQGSSIEDQIRMAEQADRIVRESTGLTEEQILKKLDESVEAQTIAKKIEGRNKALNSIKQREMDQFVRSFDGDYSLGLESLLVGINDLKFGSRRSVAAAQAQLQESYVAGLASDLEKLGRPAFDIFVNGKLDLDIARALWSIDDAAKLAELPEDAVNIAKVVNKWQEKSRIEANEAGAFIRKLPGYITRQSHDMDSIRKAGFTQWSEYILPRLDTRTLDDVDDVGAFLRSIYDGLSTGVHFGSGSVPGLKGTRNVAKSVSQERVLHFKDADSWFQYNKLYGRGELRDTVSEGLRMSGHNTGIMKIMGPNPENNYDQIVDRFRKELQKDPDGTKVQKLDSRLKGRLDNYMAVVTGATSIPGNRMGASIGQGIRAYQSLTKLGGAVISSTTDIPMGGRELRYQGKNFFTAYGGSLLNGAGALGDIGKSIVNRKLTVKNEASRRVLAELGVSLDATTGLFRSRFDASNEAVPGRISNAMNTFFRLNGLTLWTDSMRAGSMIGMAQHVGSYAKTSGWDKIPNGLQDTLTLYGIGRGEWDLIRSAGTKEYDGVDGNYIVPEAMADIPNSNLVSHLESIGVKATDFQVKKLRTDLADSLRTYYVDRSTYAVIEPDAKTRAAMLRDTVPGTVAGEFMRSLFQFKAFPFAMVQKVWGREIRGSRTKAGAFKGISEVIVASMFFGYIAMTAKDLAKNRTPRHPDDPKTWLAAFLQGGSAGIYGDFLFGDIKNRFGGGFVSTLAGPTAGTADQLATIIGKAREGEDAGKDLFRLLYQAAPAAAGVAIPAATVLNTAYSKAVLDNLIYYNIMESLSPGYKRRMEKRLKKQNDQEMLIK